MARPTVCSVPLNSSVPVKTRAVASQCWTVKVFRKKKIEMMRLKNFLRVTTSVTNSEVHCVVSVKTPRIHTYLRSVQDFCFQIMNPLQQLHLGLSRCLFYASKRTCWEDQCLITEPIIRGSLCTVLYPEESKIRERLCGILCDAVGYQVGPHVRQ